MSNGKKSEFNDSELKEKYTELKIPQGSHIQKIFVFYDKNNSALYGLKFFDMKGKVLLEYTNLIYDNKGQVRPYIAKEEFNLEKNERIIGIRSFQLFYKMAYHF